MAAFLKWPRPGGVLTMMGPEQLGRLIDTHRPALVLYARQWCAAPEDVVQEAFLKLSAQTVEPNQPARWLYRTVRNGAISAGRSERRRKHHESLAAARTPAWFAPAEASPLDIETVTAALTQLAPDEREVIVAHLWGGLTFDEIGPLIGASVATAHRRYVSGLTALRECLGEPCPTSRRT